MRLRKLFLSALMLTCVGCTSEHIYQGVQANQRNECDKLQLSQREECLKRLPPADYRNYERERQALEKK
jgi:type III secretory pathway lipoprotein EscJ